MKNIIISSHLIGSFSTIVTSIPRHFLSSYSINLASKVSSLQFSTFEKILYFFGVEKTARGAGMNCNDLQTTTKGVPSLPQIINMLNTPIVLTLPQEKPISWKLQY